MRTPSLAGVVFALLGVLVGFVLGYGFGEGDGRRGALAERCQICRTPDAAAWCFGPGFPAKEVRR